MIIFLLSKTAVLATNEAGSSAGLRVFDPYEQKEEKNLKVIKLKNLFESVNSPFSEKEAEAFLTAASEYQLDWRLLPAISGVESTFGRFLPNESYNPFGWGIYADHVTSFKSYEEGINTVAEGLKTKYNTENLYAMARSYCPPNPENWAKKVTYFMDKIENVSLNSQDVLVIEL